VGTEDDGAGGAPPGEDAPHDPEARMHAVQDARSRVTSAAQHAMLKRVLMEHLWRLRPEA